MEENNPILARIRKLFALAGSSNEEEAKVAMRKANELLVKHNLDIQKVKMSSDYDFNNVVSGRRAKNHHRHIFDLLSTFFFVNVIHQKNFDEDIFRYIHTVTLVGRPINSRIAAHVFEFLDRLYPTLWDQFRSKYKVTSKDRYSYYHGLTLGIAHVLQESRLHVEEERGLTLVKDQDLEEFTDNFCNGRVKRQKDHEVRGVVRDHGIRDGMKVQIAPPIEHKEKSEDKFLITGGTP